MPCQHPRSRDARERELVPLFVPAWEVALLLSLHERTVRRMVRRGQLAYVVISSRGDYRLKVPQAGETWVHPEGTFPPPPVPAHTQRPRHGRRLEASGALRPTAAEAR